MTTERTPGSTRTHRDLGHDRQRDDPYLQTHKPPDPTQCPKCNAVFKEGRWTWGDAPRESHEETCPACRRIEDRFPAGYVLIKGEFFAEHRDEIVNLVKSHEKHQKAERPLQRIMAMEDTREGFEITTTDSHLARGIAEALHEEYKGDLKVKNSRDENLVKAIWKR